MDPEVSGLSLGSRESAPGVTARAELDRKGLAQGVAAYLSWGLVPLFWRELRHVDAVQTLAHRTVWGLLAFALIGVPLGVYPRVWSALRDRESVRVLSITGVLLALNWGIFIYAVATAQVLEASLGYFINPLVSVLLGVLVLRERLRRLQTWAMVLAALGVVQLATKASGVPWIALVLALSFGVYGLLRKTAKVDAAAGSLIETGFMAPFGLAYLAYLQRQGAGDFAQGDMRTDVLLVATGVITALPLIWFTSAARRLPLATVGFLQYLAPTGQFLTALFVFGEPFAARDFAAFACIWAALGLFTVDLVRGHRLGSTPARITS
jgi:chloramphenicol-sensitive protein RarD